MPWFAYKKINLSYKMAAICLALNVLICKGSVPLSLHSTCAWCTHTPWANNLCAAQNSDQPVEPSMCGHGTNPPADVCHAGPELSGMGCLVTHLGKKWNSLGIEICATDSKYKTLISCLSNSDNLFVCMCIIKIFFHNDSVFNKCKKIYWNSLNSVGYIYNDMYLVNRHSSFNQQTDV